MACDKPGSSEAAGAFKRGAGVGAVERGPDVILSDGSQPPHPPRLLPCSPALENMLFENALFDGRLVSAM